MDEEGGDREEIAGARGLAGTREFGIAKGVVLWYS